MLILFTELGPELEGEAREEENKELESDTKEEDNEVAIESEAAGALDEMEVTDEDEKAVEVGMDDGGGPEDNTDEDEGSDTAELETADSMSDGDEEEDDNTELETKSEDEIEVEAEGGGGATELVVKGKLNELLDAIEDADDEGI